MVIPLKSILGVTKSETIPERHAEAVTTAQAATEGKEIISSKVNPVIIQKAITKESEMEMTDVQLQELITNATERAASEAIKAFVAAQPSATDDGVEIVDEADRALEGNAFKSIGEFLFAVKEAALLPSEIDKRLLPLKATGLQESQPSQGGFLVQPTFAAGLFDRMNPTGSLLSLFAIDGIGPNSNSMVYNAEDETSRADGYRHGGVLGYWGAEAGSLTSSKPTFREVNLRLNKVHALVYATDELLEDADALSAYINRVAPEELRFKVEDAIINGDGVGKPLGILKSNALATPLRTDAAKILLADVLNMWSRRWVGARDYVWLIDPSCGPQLWAMTVGSYTAAFMPPTGVSGEMYGTLLGRPVIETEYQVPMTTTGDILLIAPSQYQLIDKGGIKAASSIHVSFLTDETAYRFTYRIDGQSMWNSALTPKSAGSTVSPFVSLATAST
jgi:HK97 family phage major capsid protein